MKHTNHLHCCLGCGRDTRGDYCSRCLGHTSPALGKSRPVRATVPAMPLEDDYGEESDADSVCEDDSASAAKVF